MKRHGLALALVLLVLPPVCAVGPLLRWRYLTPEEAREVAALDARKMNLLEFENVARSIEEVVAYRAARQGTGHWQTVNMALRAEEWRLRSPIPPRNRPTVLDATALIQEGHGLRSRGRVADAETKMRQALALMEQAAGQQHPDTATCYNHVGACLASQGKFADAMVCHEKALAIRRKALGESHYYTAVSYRNLAECAAGLEKKPEALAFYRKALACNLKAVGEYHPATGDIYSTLAATLQGQGHLREALPFHRKALGIRLHLFGEEHPATAQSYQNLSSCLCLQGMVQEAMGYAKRGLDIAVKTRSEFHSLTAEGYAHVASCLESQGKNVEALAAFRKALEIQEKLHGPDHPDTGLTCHNLANCLQSLGKLEEALGYNKQARAVLEKRWGLYHRHTANSYYGLGYTLMGLGKQTEAVAHLEKTLAIHRKISGEQHPETAAAYHIIATCLDSGEHADPDKARSYYRKGLDIRLQVLGRQHPETADSYTRLGISLLESGKTREATEHFDKAILGYEFGRLAGNASGFDRARSRVYPWSPHELLAMTLVRQGEADRAWQEAEADLGRGLLDALTAPPTLSREDRDKPARLSELEAAQLAVRQARNRVLSRAAIQKQLGATEAIVFWLDERRLGEHLGCVLRATGNPVWVRLPGTGKNGAWTPEDDTLPRRTWASILAPTTDPERQTQLRKALYRQRLEPLEPHLKGVRQLFVVPSGQMVAIPLESLSDRFTVSYTPSASLFAIQAEKRRPFSGSSLLVLADPAFPVVREMAAQLEPSHGLLIGMIRPYSASEKAGLQPGDVLLEYGGKKLMRMEDLDQASPTRSGATKVWREGKTIEITIAGGSLDAALDKRPIAEALAAWRSEQARSAGVEEWTALPGTRLEARALLSLVKGATALLGSEANADHLRKLDLSRYRLLHLATHGEVSLANPKDSALILAPEPLGTWSKTRCSRLSVGTILQEWKLDADLVTLSACQTGLGPGTQGDGLLGFGHALLEKGARSVVLSRWKVDDAATALLMRRFYQNVLGSREGLTVPLGRAVALQEARSWLRELDRTQATRLLAELTESLPRGERSKIKTALPADQTGTRPPGERPFQHPYYWAAFVLLGDPH